MPRYQAFLTPEGYAKANEAFRQYWSGDRTELLHFIEQRVPQAQLSPELTILSVGAGTGEFDAALIRHLRNGSAGSLSRYVVVEPNPAQLDGLAARFHADGLVDVALERVPLRVEEYRTDLPFDLIHYTHSMYHIAGQEETVLLDAVRMLKPHGHLVIALAMEEGGIYRAMRHFWNVIDYGPFGDALFGQTQLKAILERNQLPYTSELFPDVHIDVTSCFDDQSVLGQHLMNFIFQVDVQQLPSDVQQQAHTYLADISVQHGERRILYHGSGVFAINRPEHIA